MAAVTLTVLRWNNKLPPSEAIPRRASGYMREHPESLAYEPEDRAVKMARIGQSAGKTDRKVGIPRDYTPDIL